jgi:predicted secreted hydrolase
MIMMNTGISTSPADEGRHEDANTEWWYFNGHASFIPKVGKVIYVW